MSKAAVLKKITQEIISLIIPEVPSLYLPMVTLLRPSLTAQLDNIDDNKAEMIIEFMKNVIEKVDNETENERQSN